MSECVCGKAVSHPSFSLPFNLRHALFFLFRCRGLRLVVGGHGWRDVAGGDKVLLGLDGSLNHQWMVRVWNEAARARVARTTRVSHQMDSGECQCGGGDAASIFCFPSNRT